MANSTLLHRTCPANAGEQGQSVYWDFNARTIVRFPIYFGGTCTLYYHPLNSLVDAWCEGSTRVDVYSVWDGTGRPPREAVRYVRTENSDKCAIANPCGLSILDHQVVETAQNVFRVTFIASHSEGVEFSLDDFTTVQESGVFENLAPGKYKIKVRAK